jgi:PAS domain S-box-containing protein
MIDKPTTTPQTVAARASLAYIAAGILWILLSDRLLAAVWPDNWLALSWIKGVAFVLCTGAALFVLIRRDTGRMLRAEAQQRDALTLCSVVIEHCPSAIVLSDGQRVRLTNPAFAALLGFSHDADARQASLEAFIHPDDRDAHQATVQALLKAPAPDSVPATLAERRLITRDGQTRSIDLILAPVTASDERLILAVINDTTDRQAQAARLLEAERLAAIGRLAAGTAHDLNNILAAISTCNSLLRCDAATPSAAAKLTPDAARCLDDIDDITRRGHAIAAELVSFSAPTGANDPPLTLPPPALLLNDAIRDASRFLQRLLPQHIRLTLDLCCEPCAARLSSSHIDQILLNLITNARDAMPSGGTVRVATALQPASPAAPATVCVTVSDDGPGIPPEVQRQLFTPFFSTKQPGRGTGLGLLNVRQLVERAGGTFHIDSAPGQGTRAQITLPATPPPEPTPTSAAIPVVAPAPTRVLLVDDEPMVRRPLCRLLRSFGYEVTEASDGAQALAIAQAHPFDAILSDLNMPDMDGLALQRALHDGQICAPLILMSGYGPPTPDPANPAPLYHWLQKPFTPHALHRALRRATQPPPTAPA